MRRSGPILLSLALFSLQLRADEPVTTVQPSPQSGADAAWSVYQLLDEKSFGTKEETPIRAKRQAIQVARAAVAGYFYDTFATDSRRWEAALDFVNLKLYYLPKFYGVPVTDAETRRAVDIQNELKSASFLAPKLRETLWDEITYWSAVPLLTRKEPDLAGARPALDRFVSMFPDSRRGAVYEEIYTTTLDRTDPAAARTWAQKLIGSPSAPVREFAAAWIRRGDAFTQPVEMSFTAVDGRTVDLASLRGKVVLIDFWATWCHWCLVQMPHIVEAYDKYRDQGFEVVGVSLDREEDRDKMLEYVEKYGMRWPHYYDGKGMDNVWARTFAVSSIPQAWLLGKDGRLAHRDWKSEDLETRVRHELGLPPVATAARK